MPAKYSPRLKKTPATKHFLEGGPWHGAVLYLTTRSTMFFTVGKWVGRYVDGYWEGRQTT